MSTPPAEAQPQPPANRRAGRIALWAVLCAVVLVLGVRAVLTTVAVRVAVAEAPKWLNGRVEVDNFDLWLLHGGAALEGVRLYLDDDSDPSPVMAFERLQIAIGWVDALAGRVRLREILLREPSLRIERDPDGGLNLARLLRESEESAEEPAETDPTQATDPIEVRIDQARIESGRIRYRDFDLAIDAEAAGWRSDGQGEGTAKVTLAESDARVSVALRGVVADLAGSAKVDWSGLDLHRIAAAVSEEYAEMLRSAHSDGELSATLKEGEGDGRALRASGRIAVADLDISMQDPEDVAAKWQELDVEIDSVLVPIVSAAGSLSTGAPVDVRLGKVAVTAPQIRYVKKAAAGPKDLEAVEGADPALLLHIAELAVERGLLKFIDRSVTPAVDIPISEFSLVLENFELEPLGIRSLDLKGKGLAGGSIEVKGAYAASESRLTATGDRISMLPFTGYLKDLAAIDLEGGNLSLETEYTATGDAYSAPTRLVFHDLAVSGGGQGTVFADTFGMPVGVAVALLRDVQGDIALDLPVEGSVDGAGIGWTSVVTTTLRKALTGALASPLNALGMMSDSVLGSGTLFEQSIAFGAGKADLDDAATARLDALSSILESRTGVEVEITGFVAEADLPDVGAGRGEMDESGQEDANQVLAEKRAVAVRDYLRQRVAGPAERLRTLPWPGDLSEDGPSARVALRDEGLL